MGGLDNIMLRLVDHGLFAAGVPAPQNEDQMWPIIIEIFNDMFSEYFPAFAAVAAGFVCLDGKNII